MNRITSLVGLAFFLIVSRGYSQVEYAMKVEAGFLKYRFNTIDVDPGLNWKGYYLDGENGVDLNIINGIKYKGRLYAGVGIGYLNFEGMSGFSVFSDFEYLPLKKRLTPLINLKIGYGHVWNQYENGTGTALGEIGLGLNFRLSDSLNTYIKSGFLLTQQSLFVPLRIGFWF